MKKSLGLLIFSRIQDSTKFNEIKINFVPEHDVPNKLRKYYSHDLNKSTEGIIKSLLGLYIRTDVNADRRKKGFEKLENISKIQKLDLRKTIPHFVEIANILYNHYNLIINGNYHTLDYIHQLLKRETLNENQKYLRCIFIVLRLSRLFVQLEEYSRYPKIELENENVTLVNNIRNKSAMKNIAIMIKDLVRLVLEVWKQIDDFKGRMTE
ncbi:MAG: hypothetical protein WBN72_09985 [Nitrososphaeraceae archaeon]